MATVGFDIYQFKFAVRIPRIKLRKPKILTKRKSANKSRNSSKSDNVAPCSSKLLRKFDTYNRSESVSSDPSFNSDEWIREFNARCKTLPTPKILKHTEAAVVTEDQEQRNFYANIPSSTSTPVSCKIVPLNRNEVEEGRKTLFLPDLTGVKIYETLELGSDGNEEGDTTTEESDDYEVVTFKNNKVVPSTLQRPPRSLKSSCK